MPDGLTDRQLAERAANGEDLAWREIYDSTRDRLFALIYYHVGNREEALDILQETYVGAVKGIASFRGTGSLESWLCGIAIRKSRDWKRRVLRKMKMTLSLEDAPEQSVEPSIGDPLEARRIRKALKRLSPRQRSALLMREYLGYSFREVAVALGIGEPTARVHYHRGKETLRSLLEQAATHHSAPNVQEQRS